MQRFLSFDWSRMSTWDAAVVSWGGGLELCQLAAGSRLIWLKLHERGGREGGELREGCLSPASARIYKWMQAAAASSNCSAGPRPFMHICLHSSMTSLHHMWHSPPAGAQPVTMPTFNAFSCCDCCPCQVNNVYQASDPEAYPIDDTDLQLGYQVRL